LKKAVQMRAQEKGASIGPKRGMFLTVPLAAVRTGNGVARFTARQVIAAPQSFGYSGTFFKKSVLFGKKGDEVVPLFAMVRRVTLKPVGYLTNTVREKGPWAVNEIAGAVAEGLK
jgi:hypothetical protein